MFSILTIISVRGVETTIWIWSSKSSVNTKLFLDTSLNVVFFHNCTKTAMDIHVLNDCLQKVFVFKYGYLGTHVNFQGNRKPTIC